MGKFAQVFKCICAVMAIGILIMGLAAQTEKATEVALTSANTVFAASVSEDYTDHEASHATIRRGELLTSLEVSKEASGSNTTESIARRTAGGTERTSAVRLITLLTIVIAAASASSSITRPVVHAEGNVHSAEQTIISYIHSQGNFIG